MKRGWLIYNGFYQSESSERLFLSLRKEAEAFVAWLKEKEKEHG